jgi:hypothetical protein
MIHHAKAGLVCKVVAAIYKYILLVLIHHISSFGGPPEAPLPPKFYGENAGCCTSQLRFRLKTAQSDMPTEEQTRAARAQIKEYFVEELEF